MPLSEHEQRLLDQIEQALYAEDPKLANAVRETDPRNHYKRRVFKAAIGFVLGVVLLMVGVVQSSPIGIMLGVGGFVVMVMSCLWGLSSWKRMNGVGVEPPAPDRSARRSHRPGFMGRIEERWRKRHTDDR